MHVGSGLALLGAGAGYAYKKLLNPLASANFEMLKNKTGGDATALWNKISSSVKENVDTIGRSLTRLNEEIGVKVMPESKVYESTDEQFVLMDDDTFREYSDEQNGDNDLYKDAHDI